MAELAYVRDVDAATHTVSLQVAGGLGQWLPSVPLARHIPVAMVDVGDAVAVDFLEPGNPTRAIVTGVFGVQTRTRTALANLGVEAGASLASNWRLVALAPNGGGTALFGLPVPLDIVGTAATLKTYVRNGGSTLQIDFNLDAAVLSDGDVPPGWNVKNNEANNITPTAVGAMDLWSVSLSHAGIVAGASLGGRLKRSASDANTTNVYIGPIWIEYEAGS